VINQIDRVMLAKRVGGFPHLVHLIRVALRKQDMCNERYSIVRQL